jgi:uracil-DNA glycosylase family 4
VEFRASNRIQYPLWHNGPVPSFSAGESADVGLLIVGLAPGLRGANCTGRPFTGDAAGDLLYSVMLDVGLAAGRYGRTPDDGMELRRTRVTNAVRCVPPKNKPIGAEVAACRPFLAAEIGSLASLKVILALGTLAHGAVVAALGLKKSHWPFRHGALHHLPAAPILADSYHCSRYNTNTGRLTPAMFRSVFETIVPLLDA